MALSHAILSVLLDESMTGYDLARRFASEGYFWRATHQQIYRELARLEQDGAIEPKPEESGPRKDRKRAITGRGREQLAEWVRLPSEPPTIKEDILVRCLAMSLVNPATMAEQIHQHRGRHEDRLRQHEQMLADYFPAGPPTVAALLGRYLALMAGVSYERAWVEWAELALPILYVQAEDGTSDRKL